MTLALVLFSDVARVDGVLVGIGDVGWESMVLPAATRHRGADVMGTRIWTLEIAGGPE